MAVSSPDIVASLRRHSPLFASVEKGFNRRADKWDGASMARALTNILRKLYRDVGVLDYGETVPFT